MNQHWRKAVGVILLVAALISVSQGIANAIKHSDDFQWSGAHLLYQRIDPYKVALADGPHPELILYQMPNYLHELYVVMLPIGALGFHSARLLWAVLNLISGGAAVWLLGHVYQLSRWNMFVVVTMLAASTAFRVNMGNGQQALLEMLLLCTALSFSAARGAALGLSYFKYSFSPMLVFYAMLSRAWKTLLVSAIPPIAGLLLFWAFVRGSLLHLAIEPLLVGRANMAPGEADVVSLATTLHLTAAALPLALGLSFAFAVWIVRSTASLPEAAPLLATADLMLFPHLIYDFVLLAVPLAYLLSGKIRRFGWVAFLGICVVWFGYRLLGPVGDPRASVIACKLIVLSFVVAGLYWQQTWQRHVVPAEA